MQRLRLFLKLINSQHRSGPNHWYFEDGFSIPMRVFYSIFNRTFARCCVRVRHSVRKGFLYALNSKQKDHTLYIISAFSPDLYAIEVEKSQF
ncbi:hypothetical protein P171DRAFT_222611 [Karstenula rhodostoma CBS 690.94]|uniref:Uncharacterized protein n=1 Tax=Karstenula rhodostoma CBS 690.94 TaxID=1392251 RepID=A0A9P4UGB1_9PLEO|nr:hypothetical protein P171DRAFT_222611 [Karstenula rhodostoma CBS 690.94]